MKVISCFILSCLEMFHFQENVLVFTGRLLTQITEKRTMERRNEEKIPTYQEKMNAGTC